MENNPKNFKVSHFDWLDRIAYRDLNKLQFNLSNKERKQLIIQLANHLNIYEKSILDLDNVRNILYHIYNDMVAAKISTSWLSSQFNMSLKGHNDKIRKQVDENFKNAYNYEQIGKKVEAITCLKKANLSCDVLFSSRVKTIVELDNTIALQQLKQINELREKLFLSTIKMAVGLAKKYNAYLNGNIIEWTDLSQEAILASMSAVEKYRPIDSGKTFTSFVHTWISGILNKKISEVARTVFVPRSVFDRYIYVQKAVNSLGLFLTDLRGGIKPFILPFRNNTLNSGKIDDYTLQKIANSATIFMKRGKPFTPEEIRILLLITQEEISLDLEIEDSRGPAGLITLGETIADETPSVEVQIDGNLIYPRLMRIISRYVSSEEFTLLKLRYGTGQFRGCKWVADVYHAITNKPMNKGRVSEIEKEVFDRLRKIADEDKNLQQELKEIISTLSCLNK